MINSALAHGRSDRPEGQVVTEFALLIPAVILGVLLLAGLARAQWNRARCAFQVFTATHDRLYGNSLTAIRYGVVVTEDPTHINGWGRCGNAVQKVRLEKI